MPLMFTHASVLAWRIPGTGGPWWAAGAAQSQTRLKRLSGSSSINVRFLSTCPTRIEPHTLHEEHYLPWTQLCPEHLTLRWLCTNSFTCLCWRTNWLTTLPTCYSICLNLPQHSRVPIRTSATQKRESYRRQSPKTWVYSVNSFISQVTLSKLLNLAQVQFHHLPNEGEDNDISLTVLLTELHTVRCVYAL